MKKRKYNPEDEFLPSKEFEEIIKLGFDYPLFNNKILYHQAFRWLGENYNLFPEFEVDRTMEPKFCFRIYWYRSDYRGDEWFDLTNTDGYEWYLYYTKEKSELDCIKYLIGIANDHNNLGYKLYY